MIATGCFFAFCDRREKKPQKTLRSGSILENRGSSDPLRYALDNYNALVKPLRAMPMGSMLVRTVGVTLCERRHEIACCLAIVVTERYNASELWG